MFHQFAVGHAPEVGDDWFGLLCELCPDYSSPEYQKFYPPVLEHGGAPGVSSQYLMANLPAQH